MADYELTFTAVAQATSGAVYAHPANTQIPATVNMGTRKALLQNLSSGIYQVKMTVTSPTGVSGYSNVHQFTISGSAMSVGIPTGILRATGQVLTLPPPPPVIIGGGSVGNIVIMIPTAVDPI